MKFSMDFLMDGYFSDEPITFEGIDIGSKWNGWACPAFTKEVADELMETLNKIYPEIADDETMKFFDDDNGGYYASFDNEAGGIELERFEAMIIDGVVYYPIGAYGWIWCEVR